ncbi:MAG: hypothetical protein UHS51_07830 [Atopobiaceae bacterium]|nr:hypothetical protein [Atopobiaceae bacterium]
MHRPQQKTYQDLLVAVNESQSTRSMERLLQAERIARKTLTSRRDAALDKSLKNAVARLVRWLDDPIPAQVAESLILAHVRETTADLSGKRVKNRVDLACPVCGMQFTENDAKTDHKVVRTRYRHTGMVFSRYRCSQCESIWEDTFRLEGKKIAGDPEQRVVVDGRF